MKTGVNTSTIIDIRKKRNAYMKKGKAHCQKCKHLSWGYYCSKKKRSAIEVNKPKHCTFYIAK